MLGVDYRSPRRSTPAPAHTHDRLLTLTSDFRSVISDPKFPASGSSASTLKPFNALTVRLNPQPTILNGKAAARQDRFHFPFPLCSWPFAGGSDTIAAVRYAPNKRQIDRGRQLALTMWEKRSPGSGSQCHEGGDMKGFYPMPTQKATGL